MNEQPKGLRMDDVYRQITARIVKSLEEGTPVWRKPWDAKGSSILPANAITNRQYSGINTLILWAEQVERAYPSPLWLTFKQANEAKARVRKGSESTPVLYVDFRDKIQEDGTTKKQPIYRYFRVFNVAQVDGLRDKFLMTPPAVAEDERYDKALKFINDCGVRVEYGGNRACYMPHRDVIQLPPYQAFESDDDFFSTVFHELSHSTAHKDRLNRTTGKAFADPEYRYEELVAEIGASFLCAHFGYKAKGSEAYIAHWVKMMKANHMAVISAASQAARSTDYLLEQVYAEQENTPAVERNKTISEEVGDDIPF
jgi:antirestriction protein ArdC